MQLQHDQSWYRDTKDCGFVGPVHSPLLQKLENTAFRKLDLFPSSGGGKESRSLLGLLESVHHNQWLPKRCVL
jgi:hypothetical protein